MITKLYSNNYKDYKVIETRSTWKTEYYKNLQKGRDGWKMQQKSRI